MHVNIRNTQQKKRNVYDDLYTKIKPEMTFNGTVGYDYFARADKYSTVPANIDAKLAQPQTHSGFYYKYKNTNECCSSDEERVRPGEYYLKYRQRIYANLPYLPWASDCDRNNSHKAFQHLD